MTDQLERVLHFDPEGFPSVTVYRHRWRSRERAAYVGLVTAAQMTGFDPDLETIRTMCRATGARPRAVAAALGWFDEVELVPITDTARAIRRTGRLVQVGPDGDPTTTAHPDLERPGIYEGFNIWLRTGGAFHPRRDVRWPTIDRRSEHA